MTEAAGGAAAALDATVVTGMAPDRSRLERAAAAWEQAVDATARMRRKEEKMAGHLAETQRALAAAVEAESAAVAEFEAAQAEIGG